MNHLAHIVLSPPESACMVGNVMGDFVRGRAPAEGRDGLSRGIRLHRCIDSWTDSDPVSGRSRARLEPPFRRYAGILLDVYFDHFLARHWARYGTGEPLAQYTARAYATLAQWHGHMPQRMRHYVSRLRRHDGLMASCTLEGVAAQLGVLAGRMRRPGPLAQGVAPLCELYELLEQDFHAFYPGLRARVAAWSGVPEYQLGCWAPGIRRSGTGCHRPR